MFDDKISWGKQEPKKKLKIKILALSGSGFTRGPTVMSFLFLKSYRFGRSLINYK